VFYSDIDIREAMNKGLLVVDPYEESQIQPASIDLRLGREFKIPITRKHIDISTPVEYKDFTGDRFIIHPKSFVLATTVERVALSVDILAMVQGRSSIGRMGLFIENAGWVDPGFDGQITLELFNAGNSAITIEAGRRICQLAVAEMKTTCSGLGYSGKYQFQKGATGTKVYMDNEVVEAGGNV
jgi:dCTP deaminase